MIASGQPAATAAGRGNASRLTLGGRVVPARSPDGLSQRYDGRIRVCKEQGDKEMCRKTPFARLAFGIWTPAFWLFDTVCLLYTG